MIDRIPRRMPAVRIILAVVLMAGCGKVETLEQPIRPSVEKFATQVQPVIERQGCSRSQCHGKLPEGVGGLRLAPTDKRVVDDPEVLGNYLAATAFIELGEPANSVLVRAPFLGAGGAVDHPEYYGRFSTATDCCYCSVLLWICEESKSEACEACRRTPAPDCDCTEALYCELDEEGTVTPAQGSMLTWPNTIGPLLQLETSCAGAGCHGLDQEAVCPNVFDLGQVVREDNPCNAEDEEPWMTRCQPGGGVFVQYATGVGRGSNEIHAGKLAQASADTVVQWVSDLGAPGEVAQLQPGPAPDPGPDTGPGPDPDPGPVDDYVCDAASPAPNPDVTFQIVSDHLQAAGCGNCHGGDQPQIDIFDRAVLLAEQQAKPASVLACDPASSLIRESTDGLADVPQHFGGKWRPNAPQLKDITRWVVELGAPP